VLARARGVLVQVVTNSSETRFVMQSGGKIFEAKLDQIAALNEAGLLPGSTLAVTGVYRLQLDEYGKPVGFLLLLRNPGDVQVLAPPPWWTLRRLFFLLAGSSMVFLVAVFWALQNQRKNRQLERATTDLTAAHARLEERVLERTRELNEESERRKRALVRLSEAQQRLIQASRQAGMAEVATGILHNVGNILNSVNISASVIDNSVQSLRIGNFSKAAELLAGHADDLASFLSADPRGRALPEYLQQLAASMGSQEQKLRGEVQSLIKQIDHVKSVIAWQQDHARGSGFYENLKPADLMEDALQISQASYERHGIEVVREYDDFPEINADRNKIFQILVNLLGNAKQALMEAARRQVVLRIRRGDGDQIRFEVSDSGVGIPPQNLERVFSMGFTTKADGHGFGLHSGANNAHEMGGRLYAVSEGSGRGATFVLELPVAPKSERPAAAPRPPAAPAAPPPAVAPSAA
jgi:signal transduction histidine kinase